MSITIEGLPADVVRRRKERIEEIDAEVAALTSERTTLVRIVQQIDGEMLDANPVAQAVSKAVEEGLAADDLPANDPAPEPSPVKRLSLRRMVDQVLGDGSRRTPSNLLFEVNRRLKASGRLAINLHDLEAVVRAGVTSGRLSDGADGYALVEQLAEAG